ELLGRTEVLVARSASRSSSWAMPQASTTSSTRSAARSRRRSRVVDRVDAAIAGTLGADVDAAAVDDAQSPATSPSLAPLSGSSKVQQVIWVCDALSSGPGRRPGSTRCMLQCRDPIWPLQLSLARESEACAAQSLLSPSR